MADNSQSSSSRGADAAATSTTKKPIRGILKKRVKLNDDTEENSSRGAAAGGESLKWDEDTIALHDSLRGTRMKIDEPKTPYEHSASIGADSDEDHSAQPQSDAIQSHHPIHHHEQHLVNKLSELEQRQSLGQRIRPQRAITAFSLDEDDERHNRHQSHHVILRSDSEEDSDEDSAPLDPESAQRKKSFELKRKTHYDEFSRVKRMRERQARALRGEQLSSSSDDDDSD
eukprot:TRINITY_DN5615_c0_g1_i1.p1 TRINITY_DN5615_c0_g1~~TRINITY_DN5615_c0_g1_i1.p1  ORF type:complete len:239 (+),score=40.27 TRINITY_DN5615_c0_g1_i1:33-719(+)